MIKKLNAILSIATRLFMTVHIILMALLMFGVIGYFGWMKYIGRATATFFILHAALSVIIMFFFTEKGIAHPRLSADTVIQRVTAILLTVFIHSHFAADYLNPTAGMLITEAVFAFIVLTHTAVSFPKALITLGMNKNIKIQTYIECGALMILTLAALTFYFVR